MKMNFTIPKENIEKLNEKISKLNRKAEKLNCEKITITELSTDFRETEKSNGQFIEVVDIEVNGEIPKFNDWIIVAVLNNDYEETVIRRINTDENIIIPSKYFNTNNSCDHCHSNRLRKEVYLVYNDNTKEFKQVGKTCLKDFVNSMSIENYIKYWEMLRDLEEEINENFGFNGCNFREKYILLETFLQYSKMIIDNKGFVSNTKAREEGGISTSDFAYDEMFPFVKYKKEFYIESITEVQKQFVKSAIEWIRNKELTDNNEYMHNLKTICKSDYIDIKNIGFATSLLTTYYKNLEIEKARKELKDSQYVGNIGDKIEIELTFIKVFYYDTYFGTMGVYIFEDENGNRYTWKSNSGYKQDFEVDNVYKIKATIKEHEEYKEIKQTVLTRVKNLGKVS